MLTHWHSSIAHASLTVSFSSLCLSGQFVLPVVGWLWSFVWGVLIIKNAESYSILA